jgi:protein tyrosine phosphatase
MLQQYQPINFLVRQEEDGGILIEPDQISSSTTDSEDQTENKDDVIPIQVLHQPQESHLDNLIWMANNIQNPYQEIQPNSPNVIDIVAPSQKQDESRAPLKFSPAIWLEGEDVSVPSDNNGDELNLQNYFDQGSNNPPIAVLEENEGEDGNLDVENSFDLANGRTDGYVVPFNGIQQDQIPIMKLKRALGTDEGGSENAEEEEELTYLPIYNDPDEQFLIRHKFSPISKRSENSQPSANPQANVEEFKESYEYPVLVSVDGKEIPSVHYTRHEAEEPSGLREDIDVYEPTLRGEKDTARIYLDEDSNDYAEDSADSDSSDGLSGEDKPDNENSLGSFTFNRKERLDVKKPGPFFRNSENNFFFNKLLESEDDEFFKKQQPNPEKSQNNEPMIMLGDPFGPRRSNYSEDGKGQIEVEMPLQVLNPDPKKRFLAANDPISQSNDYVHLMTKKRFDRITQGEDLIDLLAIELGVPRHALTNERIEDHHVQFRVEPNPQNIDANTMADSIGNDINLKKRVSSELGVEVAQVAAGDKSDYDVSKFPATSISSILYIILVATSTFAILVLSAAILVLTKHCIRRSRENSALTKLHKQDVYESERGKVQEEYKQLCRDWSKKGNTNTVQPQDTATSKTALVSDGNGKTSPQQPTSAAIKKVQNQDSKSEGSNRSSTSSWGEEPTSTNMDISTGHMVLAYMEDHLKNKQRLEQEWVALCGYEAEPCATTIAFKTENKKKNRYPDKLPYDHNRVILNAVLNGSNSDYINASSVTDHDPRNPSYIVTQGPLSQTVADFWQMIWEQGCVVIVMLSRLQDNGYQLCHRYWPEEGSEQYHIFEVHLVSEHVWCDDYLVRSVYLKNTRTGETRTVTQFHFRSWPAQSVPSSTKALLEFRRKVNKSYRGRSAPICVHCSDGVGRAGTYVLIDMVLNRMAKGCKEIDIAATLEHIRDQRSGMVQTRPQFEFCLMAVAEEVHAILKALLP